MYVYHSSKPDDIPNHVVEECVVGTTNKCGSPGSTSSSVSNSDPKDLDEVYNKKAELFKYKDYGIGDDILYKSLGIIYARMEENSANNSPLSKREQFRDFLIDINQPIPENSKKM